VPPAAWSAAVDTGAGALGLCSDEKVLASKFRPSRAPLKRVAFDEAGGAPTFTPKRRRGVAPAAAEVDPGAGALGLGSEKGALTNGFHPFSTEKRSTKQGGASAFTPERRGGVAPAGALT
jgi:hypothetical protein